MRTLSINVYLSYNIYNMHYYNFFYIIIYLNLILYLFMVLTIHSYDVYDRMYVLQWLQIHSTVQILVGIIRVG